MIKLSNDKVIPSATEDEEAEQRRVKLEKELAHATRSITDDPKVKQDSD